MIIGSTFKDLPFISKSKIFSSAQPDIEIKTISTVSNLIGLKVRQADNKSGGYIIDGDSTLIVCLSCIIILTNLSPLISYR